MKEGGEVEILQLYFNVVFTRRDVLLEGSHAILSLFVRTRRLVEKGNG